MASVVGVRAWIVLLGLGVGCSSESRPTPGLPDATDGTQRDGGAAEDDGTDVGGRDAAQQDTGGRDAVSCAAGRTPCGSECVDLMTDETHCGACSQACGAGGECIRGACAVPDPASQRSCDPTPVAGCGRLRVAGETFPMGNERASFATPVLSAISVSDFYLDTYEVTVARFRRYWDGGHPAPGPVVRYPSEVELPFRGEIRMPGPSGGWTITPGSHEDEPIGNVTWATAQAFCVWDGGRLPTEAELELAAGTRANLSYPWGEDAPSSQLCWSVPMRRFGPCRAGSFPATRGFYDLVGSQWEWAADEFEIYGFDCWRGAFRRHNPLCVIDRNEEEDKRVIRGGSWQDDNAVEVHASSRRDQLVWSDSYKVGFRCANSPR